jgi:hypothetical protein
MSLTVLVLLNFVVESKVEVETLVAEDYPFNDVKIV